MGQAFASAGPLAADDHARRPYVAVEERKARHRSDVVVQRGTIIMIGGHKGNGTDKKKDEYHPAGILTCHHSCVYCLAAVVLLWLHLVLPPPSSAFSRQTCAQVSHRIEDLK